ncbi:MAG: hypothetical protein KF726_27760 [Anaerolineae bacterium]|nr:hypothetical protein [Anaerolineae bacterium]
MLISMLKRWRVDLLCLLLLAALCALAYWRLLTPNTADQQSFVEGDFSGQFVAFAQYQAERLAQGQVPLWNPYNLGGHPFLADTQSAVFYPPRLVTVALINATGGSTPQRMYDALQKEVVAHFLIASWLMYLLVRRLTHGQQHSYAAALVSAITFAYGGYLTSYPQLQIAVLEAGVWLPLALLGILEATRDQVRWWCFGISGVALGLSLLAGHPQTTLFFIYAALIYLGWRVYMRRLSWRIFVIGAAIFGVIGGGLAAMQLIPGLEYLRLTTRSELNFDARGNGFPFFDVMQMLFPGFLTLWSPLYFGIGGLLLGAYAIWQRDRYREVTFWALFGLIALLLSFGRGTILYDLFYNLAPGFTLFRGQERSAYLVAICTAMLAGYGTLAILTVPLSARYRWFAVGIALLSVIVFAALFIQWLLVAGSDSRRLGLVAFGAMFAILSAWVLIRGRDKRWGAAGIVALVSFELLSFGRANPNLESEAPYARLQPSAVITAIPDELYRVDGARENFGTLYGLMDVRGISPLRAASVDQVLKLPEQQIWRIMAVKWVITPNEQLPVGSTVIAEIDNPYNPSRLHQLDDPLPLARLVYQAWVEPDVQKAAGFLSDQSFDLNSTVMLQQQPGIELTGGFGITPYIGIFEPEYVVVYVETLKPAILNLALVNYPGWEATLDGKSVPILTGNLATMAIPVDHDGFVELRFAPKSYEIGVIVSVGMVLLLAVGVVVITRTRG